MKVYIASKMTLVPYFNFHAFDAAAADLRSRKPPLEVVSPAELDDPTFRAVALRSKDGDPVAYQRFTGETRGKLLGRDLRIVIDDVDAVVVLPGWRESVGAKLEAYAAFAHGKPVLYYPSLRRVPRAVLFAAWTGRGVSK